MRKTRNFFLNKYDLKDEEKISEGRRFCTSINVYKKRLPSCIQENMRKGCAKRSRKVEREKNTRSLQFRYYYWFLVKSPPIFILMLFIRWFLFFFNFLLSSIDLQKECWFQKSKNVYIKVLMRTHKVKYNQFQITRAII